MYRQKSTLAVSGDGGSQAPQTPRALDIFTIVPAACLQLMMPFTVRFVILQEDTRINSQSSVGKKKLRVGTGGSSSGYIGQVSYEDNASQQKDEVVIEALRGHGRLAFKLRQVSRQLIRILEIAVPHCRILTRLTITRLRLGPGVLKELSRLLQVSQITELILDGSTCADNHYHHLLEVESNLRVLSLDRCNLGNGGCVRLAATLHIQAQVTPTLSALSLAINNIGDEGASALAQALRTNRTLYHLNLSGNPITDVGGCEIISVLAEFPLTMEEALGMRRRYLEYLKVRNKQFQQSYKELTEIAEAGGQKVKKHVSRGSLRSGGSARSLGSPRAQVSPPPTLQARAEALAKARVGLFKDIFDSDQSERRGTVRYCRGNRQLKSLSLAYTQVSLYWLERVLVVLRTQAGGGGGGGGGLVRLQVAGALLPASCPQLEEAQLLLKVALDAQIKITATRRKTSKN